MLVVIDRWKMRPRCLCVTSPSAFIAVGTSSFATTAKTSSFAAVEPSMIKDQE